MVQTTPLEQNLASLNIKLLEPSIHNPLLFRTPTISCEIPWHRMVYLNESSLLVDDVKLVFIRQAMVASPELLDRLIVLIQEGSMAVAVAICGIMTTLERE